jgi:LysM repeat protein
MKWRHWAVLIVLVLLNYIIFSTAFTQLAEQRRSGAQPTRTPCPTFESIEPTTMAWIVLPTCTVQPTRAPATPTAIEAILASTEMTSTNPSGLTATMSVTETSPEASPLPLPTDTLVPVTETPDAPAIIHTIGTGETLSQIAANYGVTVQALMEANGLSDPDRIAVGQQLVIPAPSGSPPTATPSPQPTQTPTPKPPAPTATRRPPTATPTQVVNRLQFTSELIWHPMIAPNCAGPGIAKESLIRDASGNPVNGVQVEVNCYDNIWQSRPSGSPGEYEPGHYDFAFGQTIPQDWTCTARVAAVNGQPVTSSEVATIHFDTNNCNPEGDGHQVAILNWTKHW